MCTALVFRITYLVFAYGTVVAFADGNINVDGRRPLAEATMMLGEQGVPEEGA